MFRRNDMRAVEFNWLTTINDVQYDQYNNIVSFSLERGNAYITAQATPTSFQNIDVMIDSNPQNAIGANIAQLNPTDICIVGDYAQVHAISGMPFTLTAYQFNDLNTFLYEHIEENRKWVK